MINNFHSTLMGRTFYEGQVPKIINSLDEIATEMKRSNRLKEKELKLKERELEMKHKEFSAQNHLLELKGRELELKQRELNGKK